MLVIRSPETKFNYDRAIDRATQVFWKKGYSNASLRDLLGAMGIGERSFYNTLKSKKQLPAEIDPEVATQLLVTYLQGLYRVIRVLQNRAQVERQIETLLRGLGL